MISARQGALVAMLAAAFVFLPVLRAEFVWDDMKVRREQLPLYQGLFAPFENSSNQATWIYRPLTGLSYLLEESVNRRFVDPSLPRGTDPADPARARVPHVFSLLFHILATGAVTLLAAGLLSNRRNGAFGATAGGLIFALHPIHAETVAWVGARADSLATLFFVVSLLALFQARRRGAAAWYAGAAVAYMLALLSKENAAVGVLLVPLVLQIHPEQWVAGRRLEKPLALYGGVLVFYLVLRRVLGGTIEFAQPPDLVIAAARGFAAAGFYLRKIIIPWPLTPLPIALPGPVATCLSLGGALAAGAAAVTLYRRGERIYLGSLAWFVGACLPVLPLAMNEYTITAVAERYLYLPSVGFALAGGAAVTAIVARAWRRSAGVAFCVLLATYGITAWRSAATVWQNNQTLFTVMTLQPDSARHPASWVGLAHAFMDRKNLIEAEKCYRKALETDDIYSWRKAESWYALGVMQWGEATKLMATGQATFAADLLKDAEHNLRQALLLYPVMHDAQTSLGTLLVSQGRTNEALVHFREAVRLSPRTAIYHGNLGTALAAGGRLDEALSPLQEALRLDANLQFARENLARVLSLRAAQR